MSITDRPTANTAVSGANASLASAYDNDMATYSTTQCTAAVQGRATFQSLSAGKAQASTMVMHMQAYITSDTGTGVLLEYSYNGGTNWVTIYNSTGGGDAGVVDRYVSYANADGFDLTNVKFRVTAQWATGDAYGEQAVRVYEAYVVYSGFCTANTDTSAVTTTPTPVYSAAGLGSGSFSTSGCAQPAVGTATGYTTSAAIDYTPRSFYRYTGSTENA